MTKCPPYESAICSNKSIYIWSGNSDDNKITLGSIGNLKRTKGCTKQELFGESKLGVVCTRHEGAQFLSDCKTVLQLMPFPWVMVIDWSTRYIYNEWPTGGAYRVRRSWWVFFSHPSYHLLDQCIFCEWEMHAEWIIVDLIAYNGWTPLASRHMVLTDCCNWCKSRFYLFYFILIRV